MSATCMRWHRTSRAALRLFCGIERLSGKPIEPRREPKSRLRRRGTLPMSWLDEGAGFLGESWRPLWPVWAASYGGMRGKQPWTWFVGRWLLYVPSPTRRLRDDPRRGFPALLERIEFPALLDLALTNCRMPHHCASRPRAAVAEEYGSRTHQGLLAAPTRFEVWPAHRDATLFHLLHSLGRASLRSDVPLRRQPARHGLSLLSR